MVFLFFCHEDTKKRIIIDLDEILRSRGTMLRAPTIFANVKGNRKGCPYKIIDHLEFG